MQKKALFLDRDGVINVEKEYLYKIEDFEFIEGIFDLCRYYRDLGYLIFVVTNQSGIARAYYTEEDFQKLSEWMCKQFLCEGIEIQKVYHCPHHPKISGECTCRKPKAGMLLEAIDEFNIDAQNSLMVGDKLRDTEAGKNAGVERNYLFMPLQNAGMQNAKDVIIVEKLENIRSK